VTTMCAPATLITSVQRALALLRAASRAPSGAPAKQLARSVGLPMGTTYHLLRTLTYEGYLQRRTDGSYVLGEEIATLLDSSRLQALLQRTRPALAALRDGVHAAAYLAFYEGGEIVVKDIQDSPETPRIDLWVGFRDAAHATALGRCVIAFLDARDRHDYLARHPLHPYTSRTLTSRQALLTELERIRATGVAVEDEEYLHEVACVAAPVVVGAVVGAVGVSMPRTRLAQLDGVVPPLMDTAARIARWCALTL
jgi:IclR family transcriptional regulator, acetate operon repressor